MTRCVVLVAAVVAAGCTGTPGRPRGDARWAATGKVCEPNAPATPLPAAARDSLPAADSSGGYHARRAAQMRVVPGGFGGFTYQAANGAYVILLTNPRRRADALAVLATLGIDGIGLGPDVRVARGRWDYGQLYDWYRYLDPRIAGFGDFVSLGIDEAGNRIVYGVVTAAGRAKLEQRLAQLGVPCFLVAIEIGPRPVAGD